MNRIDRWLFCLRKSGKSKQPPSAYATSSRRFLGQRPSNAHSALSLILILGSSLSSRSSEQFIVLLNLKISLARYCATILSLILLNQLILSRFRSESL